MNGTLDAANPSNLIYNNCTLAARWATVAWHSEDMGLGLTISMVREGLSGYFEAHNMSDPGDSELIRWAMAWANSSTSLPTTSQSGKINKGIQHITSLSNVIANSMWNYVHEECMDTACPLLGWQGVADLAGRGMLVNYIIQAGLVTFYAIVLLMHRNHFITSKIDRTNRLSHFVLAISHSAKAFLNASILFAMAMLLAASFVFLKRLRDHRTALAFLNQKWTFFLSIYTTIPAFLLDICISDSLRRRRGRVALWTALWAFAIVVLSLWLVITLNPRSYESSEGRAHFLSFKDEDQQLTWDYYCLKDDVRADAYLMLYGFIAALGYLGLLHLSLNWRLCCRSRASSSIVTATSTKDRLLQASRVFIALGYITLMWWSLARFISLRQSIKKRAGTSSQDYEWSFGQVLGLASWVPVLVDLAYVWWEGPEATVTTPLMELHESRKTPDMEMVEFRQAEEIELLSQRKHLR